VHAYTADQVVLDFPHKDLSSCVLDASLTQAGGTRAKVFGWYDNEWGYTHRLVDRTQLVAGQLP
jgi:glyceraldehyde 3-phosphate dehydrogenase